MSLVGIPNAVEEFSVEWLNQVLPAFDPTLPLVSKCSARASETPGQTAEIVFLELQWAAEDPSDLARLPPKMIAKYTSQNQQVIDEIINVFDQYRRETSFYRDFEAPGLRVPRCYYQAFDPSRQAFVLLLEDLGPAESPSWAISSQQVSLALSKLPALHAKWWNHSLLRDKDYFVQFDDASFFQLGFNAAAQIAGVLNEFIEEVSVTEQLMPIVAEKQEVMQSAFAQRPFTLVHGDYHAKQLFFETAAGGEFAAIDWQFPFVAQGPWDFARLMVLGLSIEERRAKEQELMAAYHQALVALGVSDYSEEDLAKDFRFGLVISHMINVIAIGSTDISLVAKECSDLGVEWKDVMLYRGQAALEDWQVLPFIKTL